MKVYVIYEYEGWEFIGIDRAFSKREDAVKYVASWFSKILTKKSFEDYCDSVIDTVEVQ